MGKSESKMNLKVTVENASELQELLQIANEQMKQLEITLCKIKEFQLRARV